jgi:hypothetical protein
MKKPSMNVIEVYWTLKKGDTEKTDSINVPVSAARYAEIMGDLPVMLPKLYEEARHLAELMKKLTGYDAVINYGAELTIDTRSVK